MSKGKVTVSTWITPIANAAARVAFTLYFEVKVDPEFPFDTSMSDFASPECCFIYSKTDAGVRYGGVCKVADFLQYSDDTAKSKYRSNTYSKEYDDCNTALADQKDISNQLTTFYNNLNTYIESYADQSQSRKIFVLPDYTENRLNSLIGTWRALKYRIAERKTELSMKEGVWLPSLQTFKMLVKQLSDATNEIADISAGELSDYEKFNGVATAWGDLIDKVQQLELEYEEDAQRDLALEGLMRSLGDSVKSMVNQANIVVSGTGSDSSSTATPDVIPMTVELTSQQDKVLGDLRTAMISLKKSTKIDTSIFTGFQASLRTIMPVLGRLKVLAQVKFSQTQTIKSMVDAILVLSKKVDKQISDTLQEIEELKAAIEADKSSMQAVEAQMKQIRPSIDLSNPESAWYFTVNIR